MTSVAETKDAKKKVPMQFKFGIKGGFTEVFDGAVHVHPKKKVVIIAPANIFSDLTMGERYCLLLADSDIRVPVASATVLNKYEANLNVVFRVESNSPLDVALAKSCPGWIVGGGTQVLPTGIDGPWEVDLPTEPVPEPPTQPATYRRQPQVQRSAPPAPVAAQAAPKPAAQESVPVRAPRVTITPEPSVQAAPAIDETSKVVPRPIKLVGKAAVVTGATPEDDETDDGVEHTQTVATPPGAKRALAPAKVATPEVTPPGDSLIYDEDAISDETRAAVQAVRANKAKKKASVVWQVVSFINDWVVPPVWWFLRYIVILFLAIRGLMCAFDVHHFGSDLHPTRVQSTVIQAQSDDEGEPSAPPPSATPAAIAPKASPAPAKKPSPAAETLASCAAISDLKLREACIERVVAAAKR